MKHIKPFKSLSDLHPDDVETHLLELTDKGIIKINATKSISKHFVRRIIDIDTCYGVIEETLRTDMLTELDFGEYIVNQEVIYNVYNDDNISVDEPAIIIDMYLKNPFSGKWPSHKYEDYMALYKEIVGKYFKRIYKGYSCNIFMSLLSEQYANDPFRIFIMIQSK